MILKCVSLHRLMRIETKNGTIREHKKKMVTCKHVIQLGKHVTESAGASMAANPQPLTAFLGILLVAAGDTKKVTMHARCSIAVGGGERERENSSVEIPQMQTAPYNLDVRWFKKSQSMNYSKVISNTSTTSLGLGWLIVRFWSNHTTIEQTVTFASLLCYSNWVCFVFATFQANHHKKLHLAFFLIGLGNVFHLNSLYKAGHILGAPGTFLEFCQSLLQWWQF